MIVLKCGDEDLDFKIIERMKFKESLGGLCFDKVSDMIITTNGKQQITIYNLNGSVESKFEIQGQPCEKLTHFNG